MPHSPPSPPLLPRQSSHSACHDGTHDIHHDTASDSRRSHSHPSSTAPLLLGTATATVASSLALPLSRTALPPLVTRQSRSPDPIPLTPILPQLQHVLHPNHASPLTTVDEVVDHAATLKSVPLDTAAEDGSDTRSGSANTSRANSPMDPPVLRPADSGTAEEQQGGPKAFSSSVDSAASVARIEGARTAQEDGEREGQRLLPYTVIAGENGGPKGDQRQTGTMELNEDAATDQITSHTWASSLSPHLLCGANLRTGLGVYIGIALVTHLVMLVDGIHFLLPNKGPFASLYNTSAPAQLTRDSLAFLRSLTITESIVLSVAILVGLTCGSLGLLKRSHRLWAVYTATSIAHVLWNLVTSSLMIWVFPREFALAFTSAFMVLWLVATLIQIYAALCSYVEWQMMKREAEWRGRQVVLRLA